MAIIKNSPEEKDEKIDINIAALKGPTGIGMVKIMENAANKKQAIIIIF